MNLLRTTLLGSLLAVSASTQDQGPPPALILAPTDGQIFIHSKAPAAFVQVHKNDPMGRWLSSTSLGRIWSEVREKLQAWLLNAGENWDEGIPITAEQVLALLTELETFDGSLSFGLQLGQDLRDFDPDMAGALLQLSPGSTTEWGPLLEALDEILDPALAWESSKIGQLEVETTSIPFPLGLELSLTKPFVWKKQVCIAAAFDLDTWLLGLLEAPPTNTETIQASSVFSRFDIAEVLDLGIWAAMFAKDDPSFEDFAEAPEFLRIFGLDRIESMVFHSYSEDGHCITDRSISWPRGAEGLLSALAAKASAVSSLQNFVPIQVAQTQLFHFDLPAFLEALDAGLPELQLPIPVSMAMLEERFADQTGLSLRDDFLAHLGTDVLSIYHPAVLSAEDLEDDEEYSRRAERLRDKNQDQCYVLSMRDGKAFGKSFDRLLRKLALHVSRKRVEYRGQKIYSLPIPMLGMQLHYALTPEAFLTAFGRGGRLGLNAVLDEIADVRDGKPTRALPKGIRKLLETQEKDFYAYGFLDYKALALSISGSMDTLRQAGFDPAFGESEDLDEMLESIYAVVEPLMNSLAVEGATHLLVTTRYTKDGMRIREIW